MALHHASERGDAAKYERENIHNLGANQQSWYSKHCMKFHYSPVMLTVRFDRLIVFEGVVFRLFIIGYFPLRSFARIIQSRMLRYSLTVLVVK